MSAAGAAGPSELVRAYAAGLAAARTAPADAERAALLLLLRLRVLRAAEQRGLLPAGSLDAPDAERLARLARALWQGDAELGVACLRLQLFAPTLEPALEQALPQSALSDELLAAGLGAAVPFDWHALGALYETQLEAGARRARGAHFTPAFAVEHLLDRALEPALEAHLARLDALDDAAARAACFELRVADLACGAGSFLVAALPRLVRRLADYLARRPLLRSTPGELAQRCAEQCLYGVDLDPLAVALAHSGIALSAGAAGPGLARHLARGNALIGRALPGEVPLAAQAATSEELAPFDFPGAFPEVFGGARPGFDVLLGNPPWREATVEEHAFWSRHAPGLRALSQREQEAAKQRLRAERPELWARYRQELAAAEALRRALHAAVYPGMSTGDPDLYKAFCWRFWQLAAEPGGRIGLVLPRSALSSQGSGAFRSAVFAQGGSADVTTLTNAGGWVFPDAEQRYTIALVALERSAAASEHAELCLRGPYASAARYRAGLERTAVRFSAAEVRSWGSGAPLPQLPDERSIEVFARLRRAPRLDHDAPGSWRARPVSELHATRDKPLLELAPGGRADLWPVYKGESFDLWRADTGRSYAWADPARLLPVLQQRRLRGGRRAGSPLAECALDWRERADTLPCLAPRIAFRDVSRATDSRTVRAALVPPRVFLANQAPYLVWPRGSERDQAYLLGVLASLPLDWFARRFVETHLNYHLLNALPVPRPGPGDTRVRRVVELAGRLASSDARFADWARAVGVEVGPLTEPARSALIDELDAVVCRLYELDGLELRHVFETFHPGGAAARRLPGVLRHFEAWGRHTGSC